MTKIEDIKDGTLISFTYKRKNKIQHCAGFFYMSDFNNRLFGSNFLLSSVKKEDWHWLNGFDNGYKFKNVQDILFIKEIMEDIKK